MSKPDNISQAVWDEADIECNWTCGAKDEDVINGLRVSIALALSQAYSRGLEDAARVAAHLASLAQAKADDKTKVMADFDRYRYDDIADELNFAAAAIRALGSK